MQPFFLSAYVLFQSFLFLGIYKAVQTSKINSIAYLLLVKQSQDTTTGLHMRQWSQVEHLIFLNIMKGNKEISIFVLLKKKATLSFVNIT